ncbi:hypothetical protein [Stieleria varia]|uniref:Uncharacterized protein n=1 Tax=Stieleria varia TaxID=2528005 RepID=A0A5C6A3D9_9BACT|nr:hypothetical protein [Stieleria varia]TWT93885.1 hypothetical protein Pla52n_57130 [Stieleria varia]
MNRFRESVPANRPNRRQCMRMIYGVATLTMIPRIALPRDSARLQDSTRAFEKEIEPPDCYARMSLYRCELELIRGRLDRQAVQRSEISVSGAAPREVYFQALTLFGKSERLSFDLTRDVVRMTFESPREIRPADVLEVIDASLHQILKIKSHLGITQECKEPIREAERTPTDVFRSIVQANRQLNLMLETPYAPRDVFQQVNLAVSYCARILAQYPGVERFPPTPDLIDGKIPPDVFRRLLDCFELIRQIEVHLGLTILELSIDENEIQQAVPGDVHDIASLLVSEVAFLHGKLADAKPPRKSVDPGPQTPSKVFQRAGILQQQLQLLLEQVAAGNLADGWQNAQRASNASGRPADDR